MSTDVIKLATPKPYWWVSVISKLGIWLEALGAGQDGPAGHLPEDLAARRRQA